MRKYILALLIIVSLSFIPSCREEIIAPDNLAGSKNQPIIIKDLKTYTYIINSENLTLRSHFELAYESSRVLVKLEITDYLSGIVRLNLHDIEGRNIHFETASGNKNSSSDIANQAIVKEGELQLLEFTGKLKLELLRSN